MANIKAQLLDFQGNNAYPVTKDKCVEAGSTTLDKIIADGSKFMGIADTTTNPGTPIQSVFYITSEPGTYTNFGTSVVNGELAIFQWKDNAWFKHSAMIQPKLKYDKEPTFESENSVTSGGIFNALSRQQQEVDAARDAAIAQINKKGEEIMAVFSSQKVTPEMLSEETKQFINASGGGTINNLPDGEDLMTTGSDAPVLKFADKVYNPDAFSGMARVYLRKNIVDGQNILTQDMMPIETGKNAIYIIQYDYTLNDQTITVPENCVLKFEGGSLNNGTIKGNNTIIENCINLLLDIYLTGSFFNDSADISWYKDYFLGIKRILSNKEIYLVNVDTYIRCSDKIIIDHKIHLKGKGELNSIFYFNNKNEDGLVFEKTSAGSRVDGICVRGAKRGFYFNTNSFYVNNCSISYNKIGIMINDGYISSIKDNRIIFNEIGVATTGACFESNISYNIIDNNLGGIGVLLNSNESPKLISNTIEGNRIDDKDDPLYAFGVGVVIAGFSRNLKVLQNWFESNGTSDYSTNVVMFNKEMTKFDAKYKIICDNIKSIWEKYFPAAIIIECSLSNIELSNNHTFTKNGYYLSGYEGFVNIYNNTYLSDYKGGLKALSIVTRPLGKHSKYDPNYVIDGSELYDTQGDGVVAINKKNNLSLFINSSGSYNNIFLNDKTSLRERKIELPLDLAKKYISYNIDYIEYSRIKVDYPHSYFGTIINKGNERSMSQISNTSIFKIKRDDILLDISSGFDYSKYKMFIIGSGSIKYKAPASFYQYHFKDNIIILSDPSIEFIMLMPDSMIFAIILLPIEEDMGFNSLKLSELDISIDMCSSKYDYIKYPWKGSNRPILDNLSKGYMFYDYTLNIPIFWNGTKWIKADGTDADAPAKEY